MNLCHFLGHYLVLTTSIAKLETAITLISLNSHMNIED